MKTENIVTIIVFLIIILVLLTGIIAPKFFGSTTHTKWDVAKPKMKPVESAINTFLLNTGRYPKTLDELIICPPALNGWAGPYLKASQLYDVWDRPYIYDPNGKHNPDSYDIISYGADGLPGGEGYNSDIYNH